MTIFDIETKISQLQETINQYKLEKESVVINRYSVSFSEKLFIFLLYIFLALSFFNPIFIIPMLIILSYIFNIFKKGKKLKIINKEKEKRIDYIESKIDMLMNQISELNYQKKQMEDNLKLKTYVAGSAYRQIEIKKIVKEMINSHEVGLSSDYQLTKREIDEYGLSEEKIWKYEPIEIQVKLEPDQLNEYDPNAISVIYVGNKSNLKIGYIPKKDINRINHNQVKSLKGYIKGGFYKYITVEDYDPFTDKSTLKSTSGTSDYTIDLIIIFNEK